MEQTNEQETVYYWLQHNYPVILAFFVKEDTADGRSPYPHPDNMLSWSVTSVCGNATLFYIKNNYRRPLIEIYNYCAGEIAY